MEIEFFGVSDVSFLLYLARLSFLVVFRFIIGFHLSPCLFVEYGDDVAAEIFDAFRATPFEKPVEL